MKKNKLLIAIVFLTCGLAASQVGINNPLPKATLDVVAKNTNGSTAEGLIAPRLTGDQIKAADAQYNTAHKGTIVYATVAVTTASTKTSAITSEGYYYFDGNIWKGLGAQINNTTISISTIVDPNILGYTPSSTATAATAPSNVSVGSFSLTKVSSGSYGGHSYATYAPNATATGSFSWFQAYDLAKNMGGYLATFTSDAEWQYVETNLLTPYSEFNVNGGWIGFCKFSWYAGSTLTPDPEMKWITGEQPLHDYSAGGTSAVRKSSWFGTGEPNNFNGNEGFVHFFGKNAGISKSYNGYTSTHAWNDIGSIAPLGFIVEFQQ